MCTAPRTLRSVGAEVLRPVRVPRIEVGRAGEAAGRPLGERRVGLEAPAGREAVEQGRTGGKQRLSDNLAGSADHDRFPMLAHVGNQLLQSSTVQTPGALSAFRNNQVW